MTKISNFFKEYFDWWPEKQKYTLSLFLAILSGFVAYFIGLPLPWMLGPLIGCGFFAAIGKPVIIGIPPFFKYFFILSVPIFRILAEL